MEVSLKASDSLQSVDHTICKPSQGICTVCRFVFIELGTMSSRFM